MHVGNLCRYGMNEMDGNDFDIERFIAIGDMLALPRGGFILAGGAMPYIKIA